MLQRFLKIRAKEIELSRTNDNIAAFTTQLESNKLLDGVFIENQYFDYAAPTTMSNPLQREIQGWLITNKNGNGDFYLVSSNKSTLTFQASSSLTLSLYIF